MNGIAIKNTIKSTAFASTLVGVFALPLIGFAEHYVSSEVVSKPKWDFYPGLFSLFSVALVVSFFYQPGSRWKSFLAGFTALYLLHSFLSDAHPNLKSYDNILVRQITSLAKLVLPNANAQAVQMKGQVDISRNELVFTLKLKRIRSEQHLVTVLSNSNLQSVLVHDTLSAKKEKVVSPEYDWNDYNSNEASIPVKYYASPEYIALELRADESLFLPFRGNYGVPEVPVKTRTWGDFYWAFGFLRQQTHVSIDFDGTSRDPRDLSDVADIDYGIFLSRWDEPISSAKLLRDAGVRSVVVRAGSAHNLDRKFDVHIDKLASTGLKKVYPLYNFDPGYDLKTQLDLLKIQIDKGSKINLSTEKIVVSFINSKISKLHNSDDPVISELARTAGSRHVRNAEIFLNRLSREYSDAELILYLGPRDYFQKLSVNDDSPLRKNSLWFAGMTARNDHKYNALKMEFLEKYERPPIWVDQEMYIPIAMGRTKKDLHAKYQRFAISD